MRALRLDLIARYLGPHRREVALGVVALVVVNLLHPSVPCACLP
jgi:ATP-binding cassette subfamily B protein